jgi:hypothetical protein
MKIIDLCLFQQELNEHMDLSYLVKLDSDIPKIHEMSVLEAAKLIEERDPAYIDDMINRCHDKCSEDDGHEIEQLKRKIDTTRKNSKSIIWFEGVF